MNLEGIIISLWWSYNILQKPDELLDGPTMSFLYKYFFIFGFLIMFLVNFWVHSLSKFCEKIMKSSMMQVFKMYLQSFLHLNWICTSVQLEIPISKVIIC
jgi:hypothetical protein